MTDSVLSYTMSVYLLNKYAALNLGEVPSIYDVASLSIEDMDDISLLSYIALKLRMRYHSQPDENELRSLFIDTVNRLYDRIHVLEGSDDTSTDDDTL